MPAQHAHSKSSRPAPPRARHRRWPVATALVSVAVVAVAVAAIVEHGASGGAVASPTTTAVHAVEASAGSGPLDLVSVSPADGTTGVPTDATVSVHFSVPISAHSPTPTLSPAVAGVWQVVTPDTFSFVASAPFVPLAAETVSVPAGTGGVVSASGKTLAQPATARFKIGRASCRERV